MRQKRGRVYINQSISFTPEQLAMAKARAHIRGLSLSHYVRECLALEYRLSEAAPRELEREVAEHKDAVLELPKHADPVDPPAKGPGSSERGSERKSKSRKVPRPKSS